ncbi:MAG: tRNA lysidine(34) synthetase TilS [Moraxella sp.]|nr:tRNA lysidine(34) synthetase TilS [Moraxella sp.]
MNTTNQSLHALEASLAKALSFYQLPNDHQRLFVACSGGRDSLSLAFACVQLYEAGHLPNLPTLIHINHNLQAAAGIWQQQVQTFAKTYAMPCIVHMVNVNGGDEDSARTARYQAFFESMTTDDVLLLAHHADDQCETVLMRLISGAGLLGLSGIQPWQQRMMGDKRIYLLRPWLQQTKAHISDYATHHHLSYVDDPTNDNGDNLRSQLRSQLMPALFAINPKVNVNIARSAELLSQAWQNLEGQIKSALSHCLISTQSQAPWYQALDVSQLNGYPPALKQAVVHAFIQGDSPYASPKRFSERVLALCERTNNDHQSQLYWQSMPKVGTQEGAYVFVRYRQVLYRYRADVWQWLRDGQQTATQWHLNHQGAISINQNAAFELNIQLPYCQAPKLITTHTKVNINTTKQLAGSKLYQTLGVAPHLRAYLWQVSDGDGVWLVSIGRVWTLKESQVHAMPFVQLVAKTQGEKLANAQK